MVQESRSSTIQRFKSQNKLPRVDPENSERGGHLPTIFYSFWRIIKNSTKFHRKRGGHSLSGQSLKICPSDCRCHPSLKRIKQHNNPPSFVFCACCDRYTVLFFFGFAFLIDLHATPILNWAPLDKVKQTNHWIGQQIGLDKQCMT